jgi:transcriptional regulator with XRE-family HTH domain
MSSTMGALAMPRRTTSRAKNETIEKPRARGGNTWAVGMYLKKLREVRECSQEQLIREILTAKKGKIIMSLSTLVQIENGNTKGSTASTIAAIRQAVGGNPYDIEDLYDLPVPDDNDSEGIKASKLEGESRAIARVKSLGGQDPIALIAQSSTPRVAQIIANVASNERLLSLVEELQSDPKALKLVEAILDARGNN